MTISSFPVVGGCLCGSVRYRYEGPVGPATYCYFNQVHAL